MATDTRTLIIRYDAGFKDVTRHVINNNVPKPIDKASPQYAAIRRWSEVEGLWQAWKIEYENQSIVYQNGRQSVEDCNSLRTEAVKARTALETTSVIPIGTGVALDTKPPDPQPIVPDIPAVTNPMKFAAIAAVAVAAIVLFRK